MRRTRATPAQARTSRRTAASSSELRGRASRPPPSYPAGVLRPALLFAALLLVLPPGGVAAPAGQPLFQFGRAGGEIAPLTLAVRGGGPGPRPRARPPSPPPPPPPGAQPPPP